MQTYKEENILTDCISCNGFYALNPKTLKQNKQKATINKNQLTLETTLIYQGKPRSAMLSKK